MNPAATTALFVGRDRELAHIRALLSDPVCRLLTLVGPGGIGKTRLALEAVQRFPAARFIPLQPLASPDYIVSAIADALGFQFSSGAEPKQQLLDYFREKSLLLVLDNLEQLLDGVTLLAEILAAAPSVRILATSRERLNLREEWVLEVGGLSYPADEGEEDIETYSAVALFMQHARRVKSDFRLSDEQRPAVARICRLVGGMPLGIELAASWVRVLSCATIADEIARSLDILETPARNVEPRHRTMRAALDPTWARLSESEHEALMRLSVFRGGFTREAAEAVAGATLRTLTALVDKSLVRVDASERYDLHELLRQYGAEKLHDAGEVEAAMQRHLDYFLRFAEQVDAHNFGREQTLWYDRSELEFDNLRAALVWSAENAQAEVGLRLAGALGWFFQYRKHWSEGLGWLDHLLGLASEADASVRVKALQRAGEISAMYTKDTVRARRYCDEALVLARQMNDKRNIAWALATLVTTGRYPMLMEWESVGDESLALFRELDDPSGLSHMLRRRAFIAIDAGDYSYASALLNEALSRAQEIGDRNATAWSLCLLGAVAWRQDRDAARAAALLRESLSVLSEIQNTTEAYTPLVFLARVEQLTGNEAATRLHYGQALALAHEARLGDNGILLAGLGSLTAAKGKLEEAAKLLAAAEEGIPGLLGFFSLAEFASEVDAVRIQLGEAALARAWADGKAMTWEQAIAYALQNSRTRVETIQPYQDTNKALADPLTPREIEILQLVAEGFSNGEIADRLVLAKSTIKWYINKIFAKLEATNRTQALARARTHGLLS